MSAQAAVAPAAGVAAVLAAAALVSYTGGVWAERRAGMLRTWHAWSVGVGLVCGAAATAISLVPADGGVSPLGEVTRASGFLASALLTLHLVVAALVLRWGESSTRRNFHRFSVAVWSLWLVPYLVGTLGALVS